MVIIRKTEQQYLNVESIASQSKTTTRATLGEDCGVENLGLQVPLYRDPYSFWKPFGNTSVLIYRSLICVENNGHQSPSE